MVGAAATLKAKVRVTSSSNIVLVDNMVRIPRCNQLYRLERNVSMRKGQRYLYTTDDPVSETKEVRHAAVCILGIGIRHL